MRRCAITLICVFGLSFFSSNLLAQVIEKVDLPKVLQGPLLEEDPFDLIFLDSYNRDAIMKIVPLKNPIKAPFPTDGFLVFEFAEESENLLQVPWVRVVDYKSFSELVIAEADRWLAEKEYAKAFRNFLYLYDRGGKGDPKIENALRTCLFQDGVESFRAASDAVKAGENAAGKFELALSIFEDIYAKQPDFKVPGLPQTLLEINLACYEGIVQGYERESEYEMIRNLLTQVSKTYGPKADPLLNKWKKIFEEKSDELLSQAEAFANAGKGLAAHAAVRRANSIFPDRKATLRVYSKIVEQFPLVFVGVTQGPQDANPERLENWGARRIGKMTQRAMIEFSGLTDEGGRYDFLNGQITLIDDIGLEYRLEILPNQNKFGVPPITAWQVARRLQSYADPASDNHKVAWAKILYSVAIENENQVRIKLKVPFVRPEALLQFPYEDRGEEGLPVQNGPYVMTSTDDENSTYELNPLYPRVADRQHPAIIEKQFRFASEAVDALVKGDIDVLDRVPIAEIPKLTKDKNVQVRPYAVPTIHMLVPNPRNQFVRDKNFRSGLLRGINRELIVNEVICNGQEISGCEPISGPLPRGTVDNDQLAYGYNLRVKVHPYNNRLGMVLVQLVNERLEAKLREDGVKDPIVERPPMILAHPTDHVASVACRSIAQMWREIGVKTVLKPLPDGETLPQDDDWDFLYVASSIEEPLVDIEKIIGRTGYAKNISATIEQSLKQLSYSNSWQSSCSILRRIHRQISNEVTVLPLWQLNEYFAYRNNVTEVGRDLVHLYQNIERWRIYPIDAEQNKP